MHSFKDCQGCLCSKNLRESLALFSIKKQDKISMKKAKKFGLFDNMEVVETNKISKKDKDKLLLSAKKNIESQFAETSVLR